MRHSYLGASFGVLLLLGCTGKTAGSGDSDSNDPVTGEPTTNSTSSEPSHTSMPSGTNTTAPTQSTEQTDPDDDTSDDADADDDTPEGDDDATSDTESDETTSDASDETSDEPTDETDDDDSPFDPPWDRDDDETDTEDTDVTDVTDTETDATDTGSDDTETDTDSTEPGPDCVPDYECEPEAPNTGDFYADCVARVNQFRACVCLPALERATEAEDCLDQQAEYDSTHSPHAGFIDGICEPQASAQNECPGWGGAEDVVDGCIQSMFDEGPPPTEECEGDCYQEHGHFINMTGTRYTRVACGMYQDGDETWSVQNFF